MNFVVKESKNYVRGIGKKKQKMKERRENRIIDIEREDKRGMRK